MLKKVFSILLSVTVLMGITAIPSFAAVPISSSEMNENDTWKGLYWADDFEQYTEDITITEGEYGKYDTATRGRSDVFTGHGNNNSTTMVDIDGGRDASKGLVLYGSNSKQNKLQIKQTHLTEGRMSKDSVIVFEYDIRFAKLPNFILSASGYPTKANQFHVCGTDRKIISVSTRNGVTGFKKGDEWNTPTAAIDTNEWYTIRTTNQFCNPTIANGATTYDQKINCTVYNSNGEVVISDAVTKQNVSESFMNSTTGYLNTYLTLPAEYEATAEIHIDNVKFWAYDLTKYTPEVVNEPSLSNKIVGTGAQTTYVEFDQPMADNPVAKLKNKTDADAEDVTLTVQQLGAGSGYNISIPADVLTMETKYEIDLSGFTNTAGIAVSDVISFETAKPTAIDYAKTADFTTPGDWVGGTERTYANYDFLYFGTDIPVIADGVLSAGAYFGTTACYRIRTDEAMDLTDSAKAYTLTYRMRMDGNTSSTMSFRAGVSESAPTSANQNIATNDATYIEEFKKETTEANGTVGCLNQDATTENWEMNKWYKVIHSVSNGYQTYSIYDDATGALVDTRTRAIDTTKYSSVVFMIADMGRYADTTGASQYHTGKLSLDDVTLWSFDSAQVWSQPRYVSVSGNEEPIGANDGITLTFDQPMPLKTNEWKVLDANGNEVTEAKVKLTQNGFYSQTATFEGLNFNTAYILRYQDITNLVGQGLYGLDNSDCNPVVEFKTDVYSTDMGYVVSSPIRFDDSTMDFDMYVPEAVEDLGVFVALYDKEGTLLGVEVDKVEAGEGENANPNFELSKAYSDATRATIFVWEFETLVPKMKQVGKVIAE